MTNFLNWLSANIDSNVQVSFFIILGAIIIYIVSHHLIGLVDKENKENNKKLTKTVRNVIIIFSVLFLLSIWLKELKTVAISIAAFSAAIVIALKETISALIAAIVVSSNKIFKVGDVIEINNIKGRVLWKKWLNTGLIQHSSTNHEKEIVFPNNWFLTYPIINHNDLFHKALVDLMVYIDAQKNPVVVGQLFQKSVQDVLKEMSYTQENVSVEYEISPIDGKSTQIKVFAVVDLNDQIKFKKMAYEKFWLNFDIKKEVTT